jgi:DNA polymerase
VVRFWARLNAGFTHAIATKKERVRVTRNITMGFQTIEGTDYAWIELPSGRKLYYAEPSLVSSPKGPQARYFGRDRYSGGWGTVRTYGGKIAENVTQAFARDIMAAGALRLDAAGFTLVGTVHDEMIAEDEGSREQEFRDLMIECPPWAEGLPLDCEVFSSIRYRK